jgi:hypothetical protein
MSALTANVGGYLFTVSDSGLTQINANNSVYIPIGITSGVQESNDLGSIPEPEIPILWPAPPVAAVPHPAVIPPITGCGSSCVVIIVIDPPVVKPTTATPEPGTIVLFALALVAVLVWRLMI